MMFYILLPLFVWVGGSNGQQYSGCDYAQQMEPNREYWVYNPRYPQNYPSGASCRWVLTSDRPIRMTCESFDVPAFTKNGHMYSNPNRSRPDSHLAEMFFLQSEKCREDALIVQELDDVTGHRYCGSGNFTIVSRTEKLTVILSASPTSPGGHFLCSVRTQTAEEENSNCRCGWKNPTRIVGGQDTGVNEYPMMAALIDVPKRFAYCGATIINKKQVSTAAHCVLKRNISTLAVLVGDHDLTKGSETNASQLLQVESIIVHRLYNPLTFDNDIALVTVKGEIPFNQQVGPACLPFQHALDSFAGSVVAILGWGLTQPNGGKTNVLQKAEVPVVTNLECRRDHSTVTPRQICTQGKKGVDACQFDSGGPLLWQNPTTRRIVGVGIISSGRACAIGEAVENTRVGAFISWIVANTPAGIMYCAIE